MVLIGTVLMDKTDPSHLVVARSGSPLVIGLGIGENFIASDQLALLPVTRRFMFLEEGDVAEITRFDVTVYDKTGEKVERTVTESNASYDAGDKGQYRHFMLKEIYEQPHAINNTLEGRLSAESVLDETLATSAAELFKQVKHVADRCLWYFSPFRAMVARYMVEYLRRHFL